MSLISAWPEVLLDEIRSAGRRERHGGQSAAQARVVAAERPTRRGRRYPAWTVESSGRGAPDRAERHCARQSGLGSRHRTARHRGLGAVGDVTPRGVASS